MATYRLSGSGSPEWDGDYVENGLSGPYPKYQLDETHWLRWFSGFGQWITEDTGLSTIGYSGPTGETPDSGPWTLGGSGVGPAPTVSLVTEGGGEGADTSKMFLIF